MVAAKSAIKVQTKAGRRVAGRYSTLNDGGQSGRVYKPAIAYSSVQFVTFYSRLYIDQRKR
jgi:hypothetical protein